MDRFKNCLLVRKELKEIICELRVIDVSERVSDTSYLLSRKTRPHIRLVDEWIEARINQEIMRRNSYYGEVDEMQSKWPQSNANC